jgi:hypothetical protein
MPIGPFRRACMALAVVLAAAVPVAAGCSSDSDEANAYVSQVNRAQEDFASTFRRLSAQITATSSPADDRRTLGRFSDAVDRAVVRLRAVEPPTSVEGLHRQLIVAIDGYGREIEKARTAFRSSSTRRIITAQTELIGAITAVSARINRTIAQINETLKD